MNRKPKPVHKQGERNLFCPYYDDCLDQAVRKNWADWDCRGCAHRSVQDSPGDSRFTSSLYVEYYELPLGMDP